MGGQKADGQSLEVAVAFARYPAPHNVGQGARLAANPLTLGRFRRFLGREPVRGADPVLRNGLGKEPINGHGHSFCLLIYSV
jgi:hypothetical protein